MYRQAGDADLTDLVKDIINVMVVSYHSYKYFLQICGPSILLDITKKKLS